MLPRVTVALAMVWLADLVGVLSTSTPLPPFVDQYSPQLPENRYGVIRGPQDLTNQKRLQDHLEEQFLKTQDIHQDGRPRSFESHVYIEKSGAFNIKSQQKKLNISQPNAKRNSIDNVEKDSISVEPKLKIIPKNADRKKRSKSSENLYFFDEVNPIYGIEFGTDYEEQDELLRILEEEKTGWQPKRTRGDIPVEEEWRGSDKASIPVRGDIGSANALALEQTTQDLEGTENLSSVRSSASFIDVTASSGGRELSSLRRKRETIDFPRESSWGYGEKEGADPLKKKKITGERDRKTNETKTLKRNQNNRWRSADTNQRKNLMGHRDDYRLYQPSVEQNEDILERKLQDYIRRNTPIDVRRNRHLYGANSYGSGNRWYNEKRPHQYNNAPYQQNNGQRSDDYHRRKDQWNRKVGVSRQKNANFDQRQVFEQKQSPQDYLNQRNQFDHRQPNQRIPQSQNNERSSARPISWDRTEYSTQKTQNPQRPYKQNDYDHYVGQSLNPHDPRLPNQNSRTYPNQRYSHSQSARQVYDQEQIRYHQDPKQHQDYRPRQPVPDPRQNEQRPSQNIQYNTQRPGEQRHIKHFRPTVNNVKQIHRNRQPNNSRQNQGPNFRPYTDYNHGLHSYGSNQFGNLGHYNPSNNQNNLTFSPSRTPSYAHDARLYDYIRRNTPIDIRSRQSYDHNKPHYSRMDTGNNVSGSVPDRSNKNSSQQNRDHSFLAPVDSDSQRRNEYDTRNSAPGVKVKYGGYEQHADHWQHRERAPYQRGHIGHENRWKTTVSPIYEQERQRHIQPEGGWGIIQEQNAGFQQFRSKPTSYMNDLEKYQHLPVSAQIYITPHIRHNRYKRNLLNSYQHKGSKVEGFPALSSTKTSLENPSLCAWAVIKCCQKNVHRKNCFEVHGCPDVHLFKDICNEPERNIARNVVAKFYANSINK